MIDHVALYVSDLDRSRRFYEQALAPLGYGLAFEVDDGVAFGPQGYPRVGIRAGKEPSTSVHVAMRADERTAVDAFHSAGIAAGGTDNGAPGIREHYHPTYYAAFVLDPDGNNIEVCCHQVE